MKASVRMLLGMVSALALAAAWSGFADEPVVARHAGAGSAMSDLLDGNARFVAGKPAGRDVGGARRHELAAGQHPKAAVLSCSDSRVPPELLFDQGLGDLFVIRNAGEVPEPADVGSLEYAAEHLGVGLVVVLGHHGCGAVQAALAGGEAKGNLAVIVKDIAPAIASARKTGKTGAELLQAAVHENARRAAAEIIRRSPVLRRLVREGRLEVKVAIYDLETGRVEVD